MKKYSIVIPVSIDGITPRKLVTLEIEGSSVTEAHLKGVAYIENLLNSIPNLNDEAVESCPICKTLDKPESKHIPKNTFIGDCRGVAGIDKKLLRESEHSLGMDYYSDYDLLKTTCSCGKVNYSKA